MHFSTVVEPSCFFHICPVHFTSSPAYITAPQSEHTVFPVNPSLTHVGITLPTYSVFACMHVPSAASASLSFALFVFFTYPHTEHVDKSYP